MKNIKTKANAKKSLRQLSALELKQVSGSRSRSGASCGTYGSAGC